MAQLPPLPDDRPRPEGYWKRLAQRRWVWVLGSLTAVVLAGSIAAAIFAYSYLDELGMWDFDEADFAPILSQRPQDNTIIYDRNDKKVGEVFSSYHVFVRYAEIPGDFLDALLAIEDRKFWEHPGFDLKAMVRAALVLATQKEKGFSQGASTITQQLIRNFLLEREKTIDRKIKEVILAARLEGLMSKEKILESYVNNLFLGNGAYGIGAAAQRYFGRPLAELELHEHALIAGLFQSPSRYNPERYPERAKRRQHLVLRAMVATEKLTPSQARVWAGRPLRYQRYEPMYGKVAPYFIDFIRERARELAAVQSIKNEGLRIYTTLDPDIQAKAEGAIAKSEESLASFTAPEGRLEAAMLVTDPRSGDILAMVGGRDYEQSKFNRTFQARRQPGSLFKPIVYSHALSQGKNWNDVLDVAPITLGGNYRPRSPKRDYMTHTTLLRAFYRSMNAPTMELAHTLGLAGIVEHAKRMGVLSPLKMEFGTMLGSSEVTMLDLARAYGVFAQDGDLVTLSAIRSIRDRDGKVIYRAPKLADRRERVMSPELAFLTREGMRQVLRRGTARSQADLAAWAAGKTGTSNEARDNWFAGFAADLLAVTWVGSDDFTPIAGNAQGSRLALPIWADFMREVRQDRPIQRFPRPQHVKAIACDPKTGGRQSGGVTMWFLKNAKVRRGRADLGSLGNVESFRNPFAE